MIEIGDLRPYHVGYWVKYRPACGATEVGRIKSWNQVFVFVVYSCGGEWWRFQDFTAAATDPKDLTFVGDEKEKGPEGPSPAGDRAS